MDEEFLRAIESRKYLDDQVALSQVQQLAFGKTVSTISIYSCSSNSGYKCLCNINIWSYFITIMYKKRSR